jgi:hypothetical protein
MKFDTLVRVVHVYDCPTPALRSVTSAAPALIAKISTQATLTNQVRHNMKKLLLVSVSTIIMAGAAHANEITYSSQGGQNALNTSISGFGNTIGKAAPRNTSSYSTGSTRMSDTGWYSGYWYGYRYRDTTDVSYATTRNTYFPTDYSAAKQVGNNNVATTNQSGSANSLNFSQGSDTVYTETTK